MARRVFLGLGTNMGDREGNLREAIARLKAAPGVNFLRQSRVYQTEPIGVTDQPEFLNMVVEVEVADKMSARELLALVKQIETDVGRKQRERWGPREIDIDILLFGDEHVVEGDFEVPHPRMWERAFVMAPLAELEPDMKTASGETVVEAAARLEREQGVRPLSRDGGQNGGAIQKRWSRRAWDWLAFLPLAAVAGCLIVGTLLDAMMGPFARQWEMTFLGIAGVTGLIWLALVLVSLVGVAWLVDPRETRGTHVRRLLILAAAPVLLFAWPLALTPLDRALPDLRTGGFKRVVTRDVDLSTLQTDALRMIDVQNRRGEALKVKWPSLASDPRVPGSIRRLKPEVVTVVPANGPTPGYVDISWNPDFFLYCGLMVGPPGFGPLQSGELPGLGPGASESYKKWRNGIFAYVRDYD